MKRKKTTEKPKTPFLISFKIEKELCKIYYRKIHLQWQFLEKGQKERDIEIT